MFRHDSATEAASYTGPGGHLHKENASGVRTNEQQALAAVSILMLLVALKMDTSYFLSVDTLHRSQRLFSILGLGFFLLQFVLSSRIKRIERGFGSTRCYRCIGGLGGLPSILSFSIFLCS